MLHYPLLPSETILAESGMSFYRHKVKYLGVHSCDVYVLSVCTYVTKNAM